MRAQRGVFGIALLALALASPFVVQEFRRTGWPPPVARPRSGSPVLSAEESLRTIVLPPGYRAELVAKEPLVQDPILIDFDADGRMWVVEMPAFAMGKAMRDSHEGLCRIAVLEDTDGDGAMDRRTVFADGLVLPRAIKTLDSGALVGEPPHLWWMRDTNHDLKMDTKQLVSDSFGRLEGNPEHNANSLVWGLDNWIYTSEHDWHLRYRNGGFEVMPTLNRGQWGASIDDAGRIWRNVNSSPLFVDLTLARYFMRNPNVVRTRGLYESLISLEEAEIWPIRPTRGVNRGYRAQFFRPDGSSKIMQSAATPVVYRGDRLPKELQGGVFVTDCTTNLLHWFVIDDDGTGRLSTHAGFRRGEIFASTDERLRPVSAATAPDGTLYVVDMYRGVVQDSAYQTEYLRDYIDRHKLAPEANRGRIWRIAHATTVRDKKPALSKETPAGLVGYLSHPNGWWRDTAQQLLVQRGDASVAPTLRKLALQAPDWRTQLHALGVLSGLNALDPATLEPLLRDRSAEVRVWAIRWSEPWLREPKHPLATAVLARMNDSHWGVRRQLAASIGELPGAARLEPALEMLHRYGNDPITVDAVVSGLAGLESNALDRLLGNDTETAVSDAVATLAGAMARSRRVEAVQRVVDLASGVRQAWQRVALLRGAETGLTVERRGRGGVFDTGNGVSLPSEPQSLVRLAAQSGEAATRARAVAAKLTWPGKPSAAAEVAPLTAVQEARLERGRQLYKNLCVACHQPNGRGQERVAPSLVGSPLLNGDSGIPVRILLSGKEGEIGLMPPLSALADEQIAAVLTYVRREWGNAATPVDSEDVRETRGLTALRKRPWSAEELLDINRRPVRAGQ